MNYFYLGDTPTHSRIRCLESNSELGFSIGPKFDAFNFQQTPCAPFRDMVIERLRQLRRKYAYLRLWFSGGKDSRLVLDTALKHGIYPDEILTIVHQPAGSFSIGSQVELEFNAIRYIKSIDLPSSIKFTVLYLQPHHYAAGFQDGTWIHDLPLYPIHAPFYPGVFFSKVNREFAMVEKTADTGDISGSTHPHLEWTGENWRCFYVDRQFAMDTNPYSENFLTADDMPELVHAYVHSVIALNQHLVKPKIPKEFYADRTTRDLVPEYAALCLPRPDLEMPKRYDGDWYPGDARVWQVNDNYKHWVNCVACFGQDPLPASMATYLDCTDWSAVLHSHRLPGIITKRFLCD